MNRNLAIAGVLLLIIVVLSGCTSNERDIMIIQDSEGNVMEVSGTAPISSSGGVTPNISFNPCPTGQYYQYLAGAWTCVNDANAVGSGQPMISQSQWDENFVAAYDNNIAQTKIEIWASADTNYLLFILLTDTNNEGRIDRVAIANYLDTNATTECDLNQALTGAGDCVDLTGFDTGGAADGFQPMISQDQWDANFIVAYDNNIAQTKNEIWVAADANYLLFILLTDTNSEGRIDRVAIANYLDTNATTECDSNQALTGGGDCVDLTGFDIQGSGQPMISQSQWDENFVIIVDKYWDGNFERSFDLNTYSSPDFNASYWSRFDLIDLSDLVWDVDFNLVYKVTDNIRTYTSLSTAIVVDSDANTVDWNGYATDVNVHPELGATETVYQMFEDITNNGVLDEIELTDMNGALAGMDINWAAGEVWIDGNIVDTLEGNLLLNDNTHYYLSYSEGDAGVLTVSATPPTGSFVNVGEVWTAGGDIIHLHTAALIQDKANELESHLNTVHTPLVENGLIISPDADATTATDIQMAIGTFILNVTDEHETTATQYSRIDGMETHFHIGSSWTDTNETDVNFGVWDDGDDRLAMTANRWYAHTVFVEQTATAANGSIELTYAQTEYTTKALAFQQACEYPTGYSNSITPCLAIIVMRGSAIDFSTLDSTVFIIDRRTVHATGEGGVSQSSLQNLFETVTDGVNSAVADNTTDTLTVEGSDDINVWVDADGDKVVIDYNGVLPTDTHISQEQFDENFNRRFTQDFDGNFIDAFDANTWGSTDFNTVYKDTDTHITTEQFDENFNRRFEQDFDGNFLDAFDTNTYGSTDFNASYWSTFALTSLKDLIWGADFNAAYWTQTALNSLSNLVFDTDFNAAYWSRTALSTLSDLGWDADFNTTYLWDDSDHNAMGHDASIITTGTLSADRYIDSNTNTDCSGASTFMSGEGVCTDTNSFYAQFRGPQTIYDDWTFIKPIILPSGAPTNDAHATNKIYVDNIAAGLDWRNSVIDKNLSAPPGSPVTGDRYIVMAVGTGAWAGHDWNIVDFNANGDDTWISDGENEDGWAVFTTYDSKGWTWSATDSNWNQFSGGTIYTAGDAVSISGTTISIDLKTNDGLTIDGIEITIDYDNSTVGIIGNKLAVLTDGLQSDLNNWYTEPTTEEIITALWMFMQDVNFLGAQNNMLDLNVSKIIMDGNYLIYLDTNESGLVFFDDANPAGITLTDLAAGSGGGGVFDGNVYSVGFVDEDTNNLINDLNVGVPSCFSVSADGNRMCIGCDPDNRVCLCTDGNVGRMGFGVSC